MTHRERPASGGATDAAPRPVGAPQAPPHPDPARDQAAPRGPLWDEVFRHASPEQQRHLLALARHQGLLYAHQLPPVGNGHGAGDPGRQLLSRLLAGHVEGLEPVHSSPLTPIDAELDADQREAVARALATPDVCLIQGLPGTGKARVAAEVVRQAARRGERVLLLAPAAAAVDRVLERLGGADDVCPVRCPGPDERPEALPAGVRALTFAERLRHLREHPLHCARRQQESCERAVNDLQPAGPVLTQLGEIADRHQQVAAQVESVGQRRARLAADVASDADAADAAGPFAAEMAALARGHYEQVAQLEADLAQMHGEQEQFTQEKAQLVPRLEALRRLRTAKQQWRVWTPAWWKAVFQKDLPARLAELEQREQLIAAVLPSMDFDIAQERQELQGIQSAYAARREQRIEEEIARRRDQLDAQEAALRQEQQLLQNKWQVAAQQLPADFQPCALSPDGVGEAQGAWRDALGRADEQLAFARRWAACLEADAGALAERLTRYANPVAAPGAALAHDPHFGDASRTVFDVLVLLEADQVTRSEFLALARRARRWVLVGEAEGAVPPSAPAGRAPAGLRPGFFDALWQALHCDPRRSACEWTREADRLCCRLRPVNAGQRQWLEIERVADRPDVELRILAVPRTRPELAEVVFPPAFTVAQAKEYLYHELEELPVCAAGPCLRWREQVDRLVLDLGPAAPPDAVTVALEAGVREVVAASGPPWPTARLEFDRAADWDRPRAEEWVRTRLGLNDLGRTARLDVPHRMHPALGAFLSDLLFDGDYRPAAPADGGTNGTACPHGGMAPVEFVSVVPVRAGRNAARGPGRGPRSLPAKGGAGLELDLSDRKHHDRLPAELRAGLPGQGVVNYLEARLVVRTLEALAADPVALSPACPCHGGRTSLAVIALYPAQAALIRQLAAQCPALAAGPFDLEVGVPADFRRREFSAVLLSLTRSHTHRAVPFGDGPRQLALALTRARHKLILVGDPGTLARRSQWEGPLDHLDAAAAAQEQGRLARLVRYLEGAGPHQGAFQLREGSGS